MLSKGKAYVKYFGHANYYCFLVKQFLQITLALFVLMIIVHAPNASGQKTITDNFITHNLFTEADIVEEDLLLQKAKEIREKNELKKKNTFTANVSAYTASADECGKSDGITASGRKVRAHHTIACPRSYALGTKIHFEGYGTYTCDDRGGAIKDNHFDIYMVTKKEAFAFGRRNLTAHVVTS